jgi:hypothetical protein
LGLKAQNLNGNLLEIAERVKALQDENDNLRALKKDLTKQNKVLGHYVKTR